MPEGKKSVLMICYYFPPCPYVGALRSEKYVKYMGQFGWKVEVLTAYKPNKDHFFDTENTRIHTARNIDLSEDVLKVMVAAFHFFINLLKRTARIFKPKGKDGKQKNSDASNVKGGFGIAEKAKEWILLPDSQLLWILLALPKALWFSRNCDVIYSSAWPVSSHVLGLIIKKITHKKWVADYRDPWILNPVWYPPTRFHRWLGIKLDGACVKNADVVVNVTEARTEQFRRHFNVHSEKFITIPNGYDEDDVARFRTVKPDETAFVMTSLGCLYGGRDAMPFLTAVQKLVEKKIIDDRKLIIKLIGGEDPNLLKQVSHLGIADMVKITPLVPQRNAFMELAKSHLAVLIGSDMERTAMTTKVYEYAGMGKPILALVPEGPVRDFVEKCGGWCANCNNVEEISRVIADIIDQYKYGRLKSGCQNDYIRNFERCKLTGLLACCFDNLLVKSDHGRSETILS